MKDKKYCKFRGNCHYTRDYRGAVHGIYNLKYSLPKNIPIGFDDLSNYDYNFIINKLADECKKQFTCLGE